MKTQSQDKAMAIDTTATPWHYNKTTGQVLSSTNRRICGIAYGSNSMPTQVEHDLADIIVKSVNERAALVAVEETLKLISEGDVMRLNPSFTHADTVLAYQKLASKALANLAAVREGKAVQS